MVTFLAQQEPDRRPILRLAESIVHGREIEVHLAREFRLKGLHLQINHHIAPQSEMIEQKVEIIILAADLQVILPANKRKANAQFKQEFLDMVKQGANQFLEGSDLE